jgi:four helix bundle protein
MAYGSSRELQYQVSLAHRLGFLRKAPHDALQADCTELTKVLNGLIRSLRGK